MTHIVDTTNFTTAKEFSDAIRAVKFPSRPKNPEHTIKQEDFESRSEYFLALSKATEGYEEEMAEYRRKTEEARETQGHIIQDFRQFCIDEFVDSNISDNIKSMVYSMAYERGHSSGFEEVYNVMDDYAELANAAYSEGFSKGKSSQ